jgi:hypothetical protein
VYGCSAWERLTFREGGRFDVRHIQFQSANSTEEKKTHRTIRVSENSRRREINVILPIVEGAAKGDETD